MSLKFLFQDLSLSARSKYKQLKRNIPPSDSILRHQYKSYLAVRIFLDDCQSQLCNLLLKIDEGKRGISWRVQILWMIQNFGEKKLSFRDFELIIY